MPHLLVITTDPFALKAFTVGRYTYFSSLGYKVTAVARPGADLDLVGEREGVKTIGVPMERELAPWSDLKSFIQIYRTIRRVRPTIVNASTPKAGLLGMLAAWVTRVPVRVYMVRGLRLETTRGLKRKLLTLAELVAARCSTRVICVSESLRTAYLQHGLTKPEKSCVLANGSSNGIHAKFFAPNDCNKQAGKLLRAKYGIPADATVVGFVGRLVRDKGVGELLAAFETVSSQYPDAWMLIGGDFEPGDPVPPEQVRRLREHPRIVLAGFVDDLPPFYHAVDIVALPTFREGFPNVPLEAAAAGLPVVGFAATGMVDAVVDGVTGTLVPIGDVAAFSAAIARYLADPELKTRHGEAGRQRVLTDFRAEDVWDAWDKEYRRLLREAGRPDRGATSLSSSPKAVVDGAGARETRVTVESQNPALPAK